MYQQFLEEMFIELDKREVSYLVLRGYEDLPKIIHYDLDLAVINEAGLSPFFLVLQDLSTKYNYKIEKDTIRQGLLKLILNFGNTILKLDVFCEFRYAGLEYINNETMHLTKRTLNSGINVPSVDYEVAISLLKEFLHNSRIREDKSEILKEQFDVEVFFNPFIDYFTEETIENFRISLFTDDEFVFLDICKKARKDLLKSNIRKYGFFRVMYNVLMFFYIKYFGQSKYNKFIFEK